MFVDATYCKARVGRRVVSQAIVVAVGVAADGRREVLGFDVGDTESEPFWTEFSNDEITPEQRRLVERIVDNVSYSKEVKRMRGELGGITEWHQTCRELHW